jgi:hypothetical protein
VNETQQALTDVSKILNRAGWASKDEHSISGSGTVATTQVGHVLANSLDMIQQQPASERKTLLEELDRNIKELLEKLPQERKSEANEVVENLEMLVKQATREKPNRKWYSLSAEGLLEASGWVKGFTGSIAGPVAKVGAILWRDFSLGEKSEDDTRSQQ